MSLGQTFYILCFTDRFFQKALSGMGIKIKYQEIIVSHDYKGFHCTDLVKKRCPKKANLLNTHLGGHPTKTRTIFKKDCIENVNIILFNSIQNQYSFNSRFFPSFISGLSVLSDIYHDISFWPICSI